MSCFWFGHRLPAYDVLPRVMKHDEFACPRCRKLVKWDAMPKQVKAMRAEYLHRISTPNI